MRSRAKLLLPQSLVRIFKKFSQELSTPWYRTPNADNATSKSNKVNTILDFLHVPTSESHSHHTSLSNFQVHTTYVAVFP